MMSLLPSAALRDALVRHQRGELAQAAPLDQQILRCYQTALQQPRFRFLGNQPEAPVAGASVDDTLENVSPA
jgi:hypothetical protein